MSEIERFSSERRKLSCKQEAQGSSLGAVTVEDALFTIATASGELPFWILVPILPRPEQSYLNYFC